MEPIKAFRYTCIIQSIIRRGSKASKPNYFWQNPDPEIMKRKLVLFSFTYLRLGLGYVKPLGRILSQIGHFSSRLTSNLGADATQARQCVICVELLWETKIKKSQFFRISPENYLLLFFIKCQTKMIFEHPKCTNNSRKCQL